MSRKLVVVGLIGALALSAVGVIAAPPARERRPAEPVPLVRVLALTVHDIAEGIGALHKALPMISPRLEPITATLKGLGEAIRERDEIAPKDVQESLIKLSLLVHRLLFDLEQGAREHAEFRESVKQFVARFTHGMEPRLAEKFHQFAHGLIELVQERVGERRPGMAEPEQLARIVWKLRVDLNRLDSLLLRLLSAAPAGE